MWAIIKKEFKAYFYSPIGYIYIGVFILITSFLFFLDLFAYGSVEFFDMYSLTTLVLSFIVPVLTMRMFAEEKKNGTDQLLLTSPRSVTEIVLGKYFAAAFVVLITMAMQFLYFIIISQFGSPDLATFLVCLLGLTLISLAYIAFGMFASSLTENQLIAAIISAGTFFFLNIASGFGILKGLSLSAALSNSFLVGKIALKDVVSMVSFAILFIIFTIMILQRRKGTK